MISHHVLRYLFVSVLAPLNYFPAPFPSRWPASLSYRAFLWLKISFFLFSCFFVMKDTTSWAHVSVMEFFFFLLSASLRAPVVNQSRQTNADDES